MILDKSKLNNINNQMERNSERKREENKEEILVSKIVNEKEVIINKYYKGDILGEGNFGECYVFESEDDNMTYAGKIIGENKFTNNIQKSIENIQLETKIQQSLNNPKVVKVKTFFEDEKNVFIVLELCKNHSLKDLVNRRKGPLAEIEVQNYIFQLIQGLRYLHSKKIIHRDLKPENLFLDEKLELKIGDFGLIAHLNLETERRRTFCGTVQYMAPEIIKPDEKGYSFEVDIWAVGIIMYYLLTKQYPFSGNDDKETMELILSGEFEFPKNIIISEAAKDLIKQILVKEPTKRPNLNQILYHDFFHKNVFPKFLDISTLVERPNLEKIRQYIPDADENGIINKEVTTKNLNELKIPIVIDIKYEHIESYTLEKFSMLKGFDTWISYFHKSTHYNFYFYEVNNGLIGIFYDDNINLVLDIKKKLLYYITVKNEDEEGSDDVIEKYNFECCPMYLREKLNNLLKYNENYNKQKNKIKDDSQKLIDGDSNSENELDSHDYELDLFYIKSIDEKEKANFLKLSDDTKQVIFKDKIEVLMSDKHTNIVYIDKNKKQLILPILNILKNSDKKLIHKMKYIRNMAIEDIKRKMKIKYKKLHPEYEDVVKS